jgi:hypothetical protein
VLFGEVDTMPRLGSGGRVTCPLLDLQAAYKRVSGGALSSSREKTAMAPTTRFRLS